MILQQSSPSSYTQALSRSWCCNCCASVQHQQALLPAIEQPHCKNTSHPLKLCSHLLLYLPGSLPQLLGGGYLAASCCSIGPDRSTARMSATPRACRCGIKHPVPEPTSSTLLLGPTSGRAAMIAASRCSRECIMVRHRGHRGHSRVAPAFSVAPCLGLLQPTWHALFNGHSVAQYRASWCITERQPMPTTPFALHRTV